MTGSSPVPVTALAWDGVIPLDQVLEFVLPAYGGDTWPEAFEALRREPSEAAVIEELADELRYGNGLFREPIRIYFTDPDDGDGSRPRVGNGMHRVAAAELSGTCWIRCALGDLQDGPGDEQFIQVRFRLQGVPAASAGLKPGDDDLDFASSWLRSFRLTPQLWTETDVLNSCNGIVESMYRCPHALEEDLLWALRVRAAAHGMQLEMIQRRAMTGAEWTAELDGDE
jgi:hypothetical protein